VSYVVFFIYPIDLVSPFLCGYEWLTFLNAYLLSMVDLVDIVSLVVMGDLVDIIHLVG
jgi:hypothetical protein